MVLDNESYRQQLCKHARKSYASSAVLNLKTGKCWARKVLCRKHILALAVTLQFPGSPLYLPYVPSPHELHVAYEHMYGPLSADKIDFEAGAAMLLDFGKRDRIAFMMCYQMCFRICRGREKKTGQRDRNNCHHNCSLISPDTFSAPLGCSYRFKTSVLILPRHPTAVQQKRNDPELLI